MNLREFLEYRKQCPLCDSKLDAVYLFNRTRFVSNIDGEVQVTIKLDPLSRMQKTYNVTYCLGLDSNLFKVEFSNKDSVRYQDKIDIFLHERLKDLNKNMKGYSFLQVCNDCRNYHYVSSKFNLESTMSTYPSIDIHYEQFTLIQSLSGSKAKIFRLTNYESQSELMIREEYHVFGETNTAKFETLMLPLIPFVSKEQTLERLKNLLIFS